VNEEHGDVQFASKFFFIQVLSPRWRQCEILKVTSTFFRFLSFFCVLQHVSLPLFSKNAQLDGLEVDQYMWGILNTLLSIDVDEVTIDSSANWRPAKNVQGIKVS